MCVSKLAKHFISCDTLLNFGKVTKYEFDTCTGSRVIKNFLSGGPKSPRGWNRVKVKAIAISRKQWYFESLTLFDMGMMPTPKCF